MSKYLLSKKISKNQQQQKLLVVLFLYLIGFEVNFLLINAKVTKIVWLLLKNNVLNYL